LSSRGAAGREPEREHDPATVVVLEVVVVFVRVR
jgi:hypothetical protein